MEQEKKQMPKSLLIKRESANSIKNQFQIKSASYMANHLDSFSSVSYFIKKKQKKIYSNLIQI